MRLFITTLILTYALMLHAHESRGQQVSLQVSGAKLETVIKNLRRQSGYDFVYAPKALQGAIPVDADIRSLPLEAALEIIFKTQPLDYVINQKTVVIREKKQPEAFIQQELVIRGTVVDSLGNPLKGASVMLKGGNIRTVTNDRGAFTIVVPELERTLVISYLGMARQEVKVTDAGAELRIVLKADEVALDDVVVTGYSNIRKESFTGTYTQVTKEQLLRVNPNNLLDALQVFDPSFRLAENNVWGSDPNALPEFTIRGESSIGMDKSLDSELSRTTQRTNLRDNPNLPLFILDGFEVSVQTIYDMDINRIENVHILKDAAATAMYGSRAANGVLVITTVPPKPGEMRVSYSLISSVNLPDLSDYNLMNASEKLEAELLAGIYNMDDVYDEFRYNNLANEIRRGVNTDWMAQPLRNVFNHKHSVSLEGGTESIRYSVNINHDSNKGAMKGSYRDRTGGGLTLDYQYKNLQLKNQTTYYATRMDDSPYGTFSTYAQQQPYYEIFDDEGNYLQFLPTGTTNPLWRTTLNSYSGRGGINELQNNLSANWQILTGLQFRGQFSLSKLDDNIETFRDPKEFPASTPADQKGSLDQNMGNGYSWNVNAMLHFNKEINKHFINANAGINSRESFDQTYGMVYNGFQLGELTAPSFAAQQPNKTNHGSTRTRLFGALSSLNYSYDNIYLLDASLRFDGSSQFGNDERIAPFWATGVGINFHNYDWLKGNSVISTLRARASYGTTGKVNFPAYTAVTSYNIDAESWYFTGPAASIVYLGNPNLKWETTKILDAGFEVGLLNNRVFLRSTYYHKKTEDLIDQVSIAYASGFATYRANSGSILNEGVEFDLSATVVQNKDWVVTLMGNLGANKNRITELGAASLAYNEQINAAYEERNGLLTNRAPLTRYYVGASTTAIYAVRSAGIDPANGREKFIKEDGSSTYTWSVYDQIVAGDINPNAQGSFRLNASFRGVFLNASFLYQWGAQRYNTTLLSKVENANIQYYNVDKRVLSDRWKNPGDIVPFYDIQIARVTLPTTRFVQNYNFLNFNSLSIGYDFQRALVQKWGLQSLNFRFTANDITKWVTVQEERGTSYPYSRTYGFMLNTSF